MSVATLIGPGPVDDTARRTARWVGALFLLAVLLQRFSLPGQKLALLLPVGLAWVGLAWWAGVVEIEQRRLLAWCAGTALTGLAILLEAVLLPTPAFSLNSWLLIVALWVVGVFRLVDRRRETYVLLLRNVVWICIGLAVLCMAMIAVQLAGVPYKDVFAQVVPKTYILKGFITTYPIVFGSPIYRANGWIGLEASVVSLQMGIGVLAAILTRAPIWTVVVLLVGMLSSNAGSGFLILAAGLLVMLCTRARRLLIPYAVPAMVIAAATLATPFGQRLLARSSEASSDDSSTSLRAIQPYAELWPTWRTDLFAALLGRGPGTSQRLVDGGAIKGLLVPSPAKLLFDYGLVAGAVLIAVLVFFYLDGPSMVIAATLFVSLWTIQSGSNQAVFALPVIATVTLWAPRLGPRIEDVLVEPRPSRRARRQAATPTLVGSDP